MMAVAITMLLLTGPCSFASSVSKKGVGNYSNVPNSIDAMDTMSVGWYYDWGTAPVGQTPGIQFIPMIWSHSNVTESELAAAKQSGSGVLLGFNEPNVHNQSNMTVEQAIADWPKLESTGLRLGSPAVGTGEDMNPDGWLARFMAQVKAKGLRVDFICLHPYQSNFDPEKAVQDLKAELEYVHNAYHLPIWVTEYGLANWDTNADPGAQSAASFAISSAALMDHLSYVERYAWYSLIPNQGSLSLLNSDGSLNDIGKAWAAADSGVLWANNSTVHRAVGRGRVDLVPDQPAAAPNYYCTWATQNYMYGDGAKSMNVADLEGGTGSWHANQAFTEANTFGPKGWAATFYPRIRKDLFFLMDDGYYTGDRNSMTLDTAKFPSFTGTPSERLQKLNAKVKRDGWRGLALWTRGTPNSFDEIMPLLEWSKDADVGYWKIDGGDGDFSVARLKQTVYPSLTLEHVNGEGPFNGNIDQDGRFDDLNWDSHRIYLLRHTDVYRTYDVSPLLSVPTTLDRVAELLNAAQDHREVSGLINCEDEAYIAATLGCSMGIMRFPLYGLRPSGDPDLFAAGPRQLKRRMDEVVRAIHWERIAEPYGAGVGFVQLDSQILTDDWVFSRGETWDSDVLGKDVKQGAPAIISRNIPLPVVVTDGEPPFVIAGRFPNGAVSVYAIQRTKKDKAWYMPVADVTVNATDADGPFGIFGQYRSLTIRTTRSLTRVRVMAQDLAGTSDADITGEVKLAPGSITIPGAVIQRIGLSASTPGDLSDPGMIVAIVKR
jgi:hypothetical protein